MPKNRKRKARKMTDEEFYKRVLNKPGSDFTLNDWMLIKDLYITDIPGLQISFGKKTWTFNIPIDFINELRKKGGNNHDNK